MGYLLKEALKTLCGVNQWSYAVFWKIGCQNPKLLIWEECYFGPISYSGFPPVPGIDNPDFAFHELQGGFQGGERIQLLVNKMMLDNHVNVVGEGLVGRAAFTGNYHWILSQNFTKEVHPPEVLNEMRQQISSGIQTVAVIPVLPHGVVQLGSSSAIMENVQFVNEVKTLILQLGCVPGVLFSDSFATKELPSEIGAFVGLENSGSTNSSGKSKDTYFTSYVTDIYNQKDDSPDDRQAVQTSNVPIREIPDNLQSTGPNFQNLQQCVKSNCHSQAQLIPNIKPTTDLRSRIENGNKGTKIITSGHELWRNEEASFFIPGSIAKQQPSIGPSATISGSGYLKDEMSTNPAVVDRVNSGRNESSAFLSKWATAGLISSSHSGSNSVPSQKPSNLSNVLGGVSEISNISSLSSAHGLVKKDSLPVHIAESAFQNAAQYNTQVSSSSFANNLSTGHLFPSSSNKDKSFKDNTCIQIDLDRGKEEMANDLFHGISVPFSQSYDHNNLRGCSPGFIHDNKKHEYGYQNVGHPQFDDAYIQSHCGDDLFDVLGVNFKSSVFDESWNSFAFNGTGTNSENLDKNKYTAHKLQNACSETQMVNERRLDSGPLSVTSTDHLLDAVVSSVQAATKQNSDDNLSCRTSLTKISSSYAPSVSTSPRRADTSNQMQEKWIDLSKSLTKGKFNTCSFSYDPSKEDSGNFSQSKSFYGSQSSSWVEQGPDIKRSSTSSAFSKRSDEVSKSNRKRLKPGENPRPRPKDRQMIQDRVKELREIVPNSAKCSIDALLERTIKHMLFLQSVTKHADKLKQTGESKIINKEGGLLLKDNFEGGATWAYEVGSQSMVCPIIVEDLNPPRQMLVEMLCEERGLFLEIADIVRGLGLTILKGVMETRNDKIWARFAVEANRDVTRMEIFISLVRLLEQTVKNSATSGNCVGNDGVMAHQPFHTGVSVPATGRPRSFQ